MRWRVLWHAIFLRIVELGACDKITIFSSFTSKLLVFFTWKICIYLQNTIQNILEWLIKLLPSNWAYKWDEDAVWRVTRQNLCHVTVHRAETSCTGEAELAELNGRNPECLIRPRAYALLAPSCDTPSWMSPSFWNKIRQKWQHPRNHTNELVP